MATLTIRKLPDEVHRRLRLRAARHGRSMEAEVRLIIAIAVAEAEEADRKAALDELHDMIRAHYGGEMPTGVVDDFIRERHEEAAKEAAEDDAWATGLIRQ